MSPGITSPACRPVLANAQWLSAAPGKTTMSPFARCPLSHIPPASNCSDSPMQLKLHLFCRHISLLGQSLFSLHFVELVGEQTPLLGAIASVRFSVPFESGSTETGQ